VHTIEARILVHTANAHILIIKLVHTSSVYAGCSDGGCNSLLIPFSVDMHGRLSDTAMQVLTHVEAFAAKARLASCMWRGSYGVSLHKDLAGGCCELVPFHRIENNVAGSLHWSLVGTFVPRCAWPSAEVGGV
jgi:hypothetical protein